MSQRTTGVSPEQKALEAWWNEYPEMRHAEILCGEKLRVHVRLLQCFFDLDGGDREVGSGEAGTLLDAIKQAVEKAKEFELKSIRQVLHGVPLTDEQRERHEESGESFHVPAIVHRTGGVSADKLNTCGICGAEIIPDSLGGWLSISEAEADKIRRGKQ